MNFEYSEKLIFWAEWFQQEANRVRSFYLYYFPADNSIEIYDHTTKKMFLRRTRVEGFSAANFHIGAKLNILGRQIDILDYADSATRTKIANLREQTFCLLKPSAFPVMDKIIKRLSKFAIGNCVMVHLNKEETRQFYSDKEGDASLPFLMEHLVSGPILGLELTCKNAVQTLLELAGPEDPLVARVEAPDSIRAQFGEDNIVNCIHCSESSKQAEREINFFFRREKPFKSTAVYDNTTLGIVKPHAIKENKLGDIISLIYGGNMKITAMKMVFLERPSVEEFYEVYKGVAPEYIPMVLEMANGPCVAMEVKSQQEGVNSYKAFRELCGPVDTELAKLLRPSTIRAQLGVTKVQNAIHCTDLEEDTVLEVEYFFKIV